MELYTQAMSACKVDGMVDLPRALDIATLLHRSGVEADKKFYAALMAVAGKAARLDLALETLERVTADGMVFSSTLANALMYAAQQDTGLMRRVYDFCAHHGVYPEISQYNRCACNTTRPASQNANTRRKENMGQWLGRWD